MNNSKEKKNMNKVIITIGPLTFADAASVEQHCVTEDLDFDVRLLSEKKKSETTNNTESAHHRKKRRRARITAEVVKQSRNIRRENHHISAVDLASQLGIGHSTAAKMMNGEYDHLLPKHTRIGKLTASDVQGVKELYLQEGLSQNQIANSTGLGHETVRRCLSGERDELLSKHERDGDIRKE
jgi:transcriptional regulator with XRE-family HTH domain